MLHLNQPTQDSAARDAIINSIRIPKVDQRVQGKQRFRLSDTQNASEETKCTVIFQGEGGQGDPITRGSYLRLIDQGSL